MIRVAITGPESCGKTTLADALSVYFDAPLISEYARTFLESSKGFYDQKDLDKIAQGHLENMILSQNSINIIDTDFVVLQIWSQEKYGNVSEFISNQVNANHFDLHILCAPDIPWEQDDLRENPEDRELLFERYKLALIQAKKKFIIVKGSHESRIEKSVSSIKTILN